MSTDRPPVILMNMAVDMVAGKECDTLNSQYSQRVADVGGIPLLMPSIERADLIESWLDLADGVLLVGGKDYDPAFYGCKARPETFLGRMRPHFDIAFGKAVMQRKMPVLGICAGCQLINIVCGGKLIQHLDNADDFHKGGKMHDARIIRNGYIADAVNLAANDHLTVNSFHHQAVDPENLGANLQITAQAFDGTVEAIELDTPDRMVLGVQFHPERMDDLAAKIFKKLCSQAILYRQNQR